MIIRTLSLMLTLCIAALLAACTLGADDADTTATPPPASDAADAEAGPLIAWAESGDLYVWRPGDDAPRLLAEGGVVRPYVAPDGAHIAFTRGPAGTTETLWVVDSDGAAEIQLVGAADLERYGGRGLPLIGQVEWYSERALYFNTLRFLEFTAEAEDDLFRADIRTREVSLILARDNGGQFSIGPAGETIIVIYPGTVGRQDGRIRAVDPLGQSDPRDLLYYVGVATGAEYAFYPAIHWESPDSVLVAIPDSDAVYAEGQADAPPVALWRLGTAGGQRSVIGQVDASLYGLPVWSADSGALAYMRRGTGEEANRFTLVLAGPDGGGPISYAVGPVGEIQPPQWLPGSAQVAFALGDPGTWWLGAAGREPVRFPVDGEVVLTAPVFAGDWVVYATLNVDGLPELRYAPLAGGSPVVVAATGSGLPVFDAVE